MILRSCAAMLALVVGMCATAAQARPPGLTVNGLTVNGLTVNGGSLNGREINGREINGAAVGKAQLKAVILQDSSVIVLR